MVIESAMPAMMGSLRAKLSEWPRLQKPVGDDAAENAAEASAKSRHGGRKADLEHRHVARLRKVERKPCEKEPGERGDAVLADVDADQHAIAQQHFDRGPGERVLALRSCPCVGVHQAAAALDEFNLGGEMRGCSLTP